MPRNADLDRIIQQLQNNDPPLQSLDLSDQYLSAEHVKPLAQALERNTSLTSLDLRSNSSGKEGAIALATALERNTSLRWLDLGNNAIHKEGAIALGTALKRNTSLEWLNLESNGISEEGAIELATALEVNSSLIALDLCLNRIGTDSAAALAKALMSNRSLTWLNLEGNFARGKENSTEIDQALERNIKLKERAFVLKIIDIARIGKLPVEIFKMIGHTAAENMYIPKTEKEIDNMLSLVFANISKRMNSALPAEEKRWQNDWKGKRIFHFPIHSPFFSLPPVPSYPPPPPPMRSQKADEKENTDKPSSSIECFMQ